MLLFSPFQLMEAANGCFAKTIPESPLHLNSVLPSPGHVVGHHVVLIFFF